MVFNDGVPHFIQKTCKELVLGDKVLVTPNQLATLVEIREKGEWCRNLYFDSGYAITAGSAVTYLVHVD